MAYPDEWTPGWPEGFDEPAPKGWKPPTDLEVYLSPAGAVFHRRVIEGREVVGLRVEPATQTA